MKVNITEEHIELGRFQEANPSRCAIAIALLEFEPLQLAVYYDDINFDGEVYICSEALREWQETYADDHNAEPITIEFDESNMTVGIV